MSLSAVGDSLEEARPAGISRFGWRFCRGGVGRNRGAGVQRPHSGASKPHYYGKDAFASAAAASVSASDGPESRQPQALQAKKCLRLLTGLGEMSSTRAIRADVGLAVSGRLVLNFVPNKVQQSTLRRDCCTHDALRKGRVLCFFGSSAVGGSIRFSRMSSACSAGDGKFECPERVWKTE
jgi:hypothetical protein